jgi:hypothetical protein
MCQSLVAKRLAGDIPPSPVASPAEKKLLSSSHPPSVPNVTGLQQCVSGLDGLANGASPSAADDQCRGDGDPDTVGG